MGPRMITTYAVIPTRGRDTLWECVEAIRPQVDAVILVDTGSPDHLAQYGYLEIVRDDGPRNISRWWNLGLDHAVKVAGNAPAWNVAVLNDDVIVPPDWIARVTSALRASSGTLAYPDTQYKITGFAFVLAGELGIRADERFVWWYGDDDIQFQAAQHGTVVTVPNAAVEHRYRSVQTYESVELIQQTERDRESFVAKWGRMP